MRSRHAFGPFGLASLLVVGLAACGSDPPSHDQGGAGAMSTGAGATMSTGGGAGGSSIDAGAGGSANADPPGLDASSDDGAGRGETPFERPDVEVPYVPASGTCGMDAPAFCDTFESGPTTSNIGGRSAELDPVAWSVTRGGPWEHATLDAAFPIGPALLPPCRAGQPKTVLPNADALICDPVPTRPTRHLLTIAAAQNYGLSTYRIRRPFDFAGRTGTIKFDADLTNNALGGWPAIVISQDPSPAPSFDWEERGSGPRHGVEIEFIGGWCNNPHSLELGLFTFRDYVQKAKRGSFDCATPHATTSPGSLNHVEIYLTDRHLEVWVSDVSPDGRTFPNLHQLLAEDIDLPFTRGYVTLAVRNHATMKYWQGSAWNVVWDNVGFDGPIVKDVREYSAPDALTATHGLEGCLIGGACLWRGDVIAEHPSDGALCATSCMFDGEGRNVGYVVPNSDEPPVKVTIPGVDLHGATRARLVFAATYPWFDWNGVSKPPTAMNLRYRLNGGAFHDRFVTDIETNAFTDFSPEIGGAGHGAGLLNQTIDLELSELRDGVNTIEFLGAGTWTGSYRIAVDGVDLLLTVAP